MTRKIILSSFNEYLKILMSGIGEFQLWRNYCHFAPPIDPLDVLKTWIPSIHGLELLLRQLFASMGNPRRK